METAKFNFLDSEITYPCSSIVIEPDMLTITVVEGEPYTISANIGRQLQRQMNHFDKESVDYEIMPYKFNINIGSETFEECFLSTVNYQTMDASCPMTMILSLRYEGRK